MLKIHMKKERNNNNKKLSIKYKYARFNQICMYSLVVAAHIYVYRKRKRKRNTQNKTKNTCTRLWRR